MSKVELIVSSIIASLVVCLGVVCVIFINFFLQFVAEKEREQLDNNYIVIEYEMLDYGYSVTTIRNSRAEKCYDILGQDRVLDVYPCPLEKDNTNDQNSSQR